MAQHVGFYEIITDSVITVESGVPGHVNDPDKTLSFGPPANTAIDNPAVLSFMVRFTDAVNMRFRINLNGVNVVALNESGNFKSFVQEVVGNPGNNLIKPGVPNTLNCFIESGTGGVSFSDMVIWYQRNI